MEKLPYNPLVLYVKKRIKNNKNWLCVVLGQTGSGKTYHAIAFALKCAQEMGTNFTIKTNVAFSFVDALKLSQLQENKKPGTTIIVEETGTFLSGSSSRSWQSTANLFTSSWLQTNRHRQQNFILTLPNFGLLDKSTRQLMHTQLLMMGIDHQKKLSYSKPLILSTHPTSGKTYAKYLRVEYRGVKCKFNRMAMEMPPAEIIEEYEKEKTKFTSKLNQAILERSEAKDTAPKKAQVDRIVELKEQGYTNVQIAKRLGIVPLTVTRKLKQAKQNNNLSEPKQLGGVSPIVDSLN